MTDPILEALTFSLESDLEVCVDETSSSINIGVTTQHTGKNVNKQKNYTNHFLPSAVILGQNSQTPCPIDNCVYICEPFFGNNADESSGSSNSPKQLFLKHLLETHNFVIDNVDQIANLHKYILHWKERFKDKKLTDFCVSFLTNNRPKVGQVLQEAASSEDTKKESTEAQTYYMITDVLPEDKELRGKIWNDRLELVLEVNRKEREQTDFIRQCIFCKYLSSGNRSNLFQHMANDHSFHIGQPDNIVFIEELFDLIDNKLNRFICIYCEKVFKDKTVLREHMRKKQHRRINPSNPEYDRFYVVNYLEPGKTWKVLEDEDPEDDRVEEEWMEVKEEGTSIVCLFCSHQSTDFDQILSHMVLQHRFNFIEVTADLDFYQKVKIVNFIRRCVYQNTCLYCEKRFMEKPSLLSHLLKHTGQSDNASKTLFPTAKTWNQPEYYFPTYENDQFLILLDKDNKSEDVVVGANDPVDEAMVVIPEESPFFSKHSSPQDKANLSH